MDGTDLLEPPRRLDGSDAAGGARVKRSANLDRAQFAFVEPCSQSPRQHAAARGAPDLLHPSANKINFCRYLRDRLDSLDRIETEGQKPRACRRRIRSTSGLNHRQIAGIDLDDLRAQRLRLQRARMRLAPLGAKDRHPLAQGLSDRR